MPIRDLLQAQVEQMGKALGKVLVDVLDLKSTGKLSEGIDVCNEQLNSILDIQPGELLNMSFDELKSFVTNQNLIEGHLEILSEYFTILGHHLKDTNAMSRPAFQKAIDILTLADEQSQTFSLSRLEAKRKLHNNFV